MPGIKGHPHKIDITGRIYGQWTVLSRAKGSVWLCKCSCGTEKTVQGNALKLGKSKSCGCTQFDIQRKHGMEGTPTYNVWAHMLARCRNPKTQMFERWGGRGIKVCKEWESFKNFFADMGEKPDGMSIDRVENDGDYCKANCRWATTLQQIRNRENTPRVQYQGKEISVSELAEMHGMKRGVVYARIMRGCSVEEAVSSVRRGRWGETKSKVKAIV